MSKSFIQVKIPREVDHLAGPIQCFFEAMVYKLAVNAHKGEWRLIGVREAMKRLIEEKDELEDAINRGNAIEILLEGADVANFALILSNIAINGLNSEHKLGQAGDSHAGDGSGSSGKSRDEYGGFSGQAVAEAIYTGNRNMPSPEQAAADLRSSRAKAAGSDPVVHSAPDQKPDGG